MKCTYTTQKEKQFLASDEHPINMKYYEITVLNRMFHVVLVYELHKIMKSYSSEYVTSIKFLDIALEWMF